MLTTSKKWAFVVGFLIVVAALTLAVSRPGLREGFNFAKQPAALRQPAAAGPAEPAAKQPVQAAFAASPGGQAADARAAASQTMPRFDVVRVEPTGEMVLAGQGAPDATITLLGGGRVLGEARTDAGGRFAMLPPALKTGAHALTLRQTADLAPLIESRQSVAVSVPDRGKGPVVVALAEPGAATKLLEPTSTSTASRPASSQPAAATADVPVKPAETSADQPLVVRSVELENGSGFYATGAAAPGTKLRVYLNNSHLTDVAAAANGNWSVKIRKGLTGGHYVVRADGSMDGTTVSARAEVPFEVPLAMSDAPAGGRMPRSAALPADTVAAEPGRSASMPASQPPVQGGAAREALAAPDAVIEEISTASVRAGDNLWDISRARLGEGRRYTRIFAANAKQIRDPRLIYPGQVFVLPESGN